jgi:photosystem II stability/assembly factor-like uncharacterized protein
MTKILTLLCLALAVLPNTLQTQVMSPLSIPQKTQDMPEWAEHLYTSPLNLLRLDSAYTAYYNIHTFEKNNYTRYYKRLRRTSAPFLQSDGTIRDLTTNDIIRNETKIQHSLQSPTATQWKVIGPTETFVPFGQLPENNRAFPYQINIYAFDIAPSNPNILYAVSETGGFYKTTDKGKLWITLEPGVYSNSEAVAIHPTNPDVVYVGISGGIIRTTDGGSTWKTVWTLKDAWTYDIEVNADNPSVVWAATNKGFYRSSDVGNTWTRNLDNSNCEMETNPANRNIVYTLRYNPSVKRHEFWKSTDGGQNFTLKINGWLNTIASEGGGRMAVSPASPNRIYAVLLGEADRPYILRSDDAGENWRVAVRGKTDSLSMGNYQGFYDLSICASHTNADKVIVGTGATYRSDNGASTFKVLNGAGNFDFYIHADLQEAKCIGGETWLATDGGINYSTDCFTDPKNHDIRVRGLNGSDFWGFDAGWNEDVLTGGRYHNGNTVWYENYGGKFQFMYGGESATGYVNPINNRQLFYSDAGCVTIPSVYGGGTIERAVGKFPNESYYYMHSSEMVWDPRCYSTVWIGKGNTMWRSTNNALTYDSVWSSPDKDSYLMHIEIARSNPNVMYVNQHNGTQYSGRIWKTTDAGTTWRALPAFPGTTVGERNVMQISVSGENENIIMAALRSGSAINKVFKSTDGGTTWLNLTTPTIKDVAMTDMVHQLGTNDGIYIAAQQGRIYYRNASMNDWVEMGNGLLFANFTRALKPFYRDNKLRSGSALGIWETSLYEHSKPIAQPSVDKTFSSCERDTFYFDDYSVLERANATWRWSFPGAEYISDSTTRNPKVVYRKPGIYSFTLTVKNDYGSSTKTIENYITIEPSVCGVDSIADKALDLGGDKDIVLLPAIPSLTGVQGVTVSAWVKLDTAQIGSSRIINHISTTSYLSLGFESEYSKRTTNVAFSWIGAPYDLSSPFSLPTREWVHLAMTVTPDSITLYKNGEPKGYAIKTDFTKVDMGQTSWKIGDGSEWYNANYQGQIEELKIYKRALSTEEIRKAMHLIHNNEEGLVAYYQFNEKQTTTFYNRVGSEHATNVGGKLVTSTAPVARGLSEIATRTNDGWQFSTIGLRIHARNESDTSKRMLGAYRLLAEPDTMPGLATARRFTNSYWILHSWGSNHPLTTDSLILTKIGAMSSDDAKSPNNFIITKRSKPNEHLNNWFMIYPTRVDSTLQLVALEADSNAIGQYIIATRGDSPLGVEETADTYPIQLIPNPAVGMVTVLLNLNTPVTLRILNSLGQTVLTENCTTQQATLNISSLPIGTYTIQIESRNTYYTRRLMIVR